MKTIGMFQLNQVKFKLMSFEGKWADSFGSPEVNFSSVVYGASGNGKTDFCVKFAKYLSQFGNVLYLSHEEGISSTIQQAFQRNKMIDTNKRVILAEKANVKQLADYLGKRNSPKFIFIDSLDHMGMTTDDFKFLEARFPKKSFIIISWSKGDRPKTQPAKDIEYISDIKIYVDKYVAYPRSRFGGNKPFIIWEEKAVLHQNEAKPKKRHIVEQPQSQLELSVENTEE